VANKSPATASNSKKKNKVSKPKVAKESLNKILEPSKGSKTKLSQETRKLENSKSKEINTELPKTFKNNIITSNIKWLIPAIFFFALIGLYYYQSQQTKINGRAQFKEIEQQLESFQTNLANTLVNDQNDKIEKINKNLNQVLKANAYLSEQNKDLVEKINKITTSTKINAAPDNTQETDIVSLDNKKLLEGQKIELENNKLILAIEKTEATVKTLEKKLQNNKLKNNLSLDFNGVLSSFSQGKPFGESLSNIATQLNIILPEDIRENAFIGIKTVEKLRESFPEEARSALKEINSKNVKDNISQKILVFLRSHITARSLTPRSGDSIDAILSRTERNLKLNNLGDALRELQNLPEDAKNSINTWMIEAQITYKTKAVLDKIFTKITEMREIND